MRERVGPKFGVDERRESNTRDIRARPTNLGGGGGGGGGFKNQDKNNSPSLILSPV